ncbi:hypothetical protein SAMN04487912_107298 [Arthrobacter sp. cf158]|uniref:hypothetical protein n=1 Tax=Arthrobacter sp. cf158 TaxID=1761744 RepID=UPI00089A0633|nr:hypothetical protein [Arthrobacter sp. cf158]SDX14709.1 hypothetical protein SAMN04487912_107298 [Arthrobacter sp. cf158]
MTYRDTEREAIVDELMLDADLADASDVRQTLLSLGSMANSPVPAPSAELAAMLAGPHDELSKRRWRHKHRTAVVSVAVVAAMGLGVSGVAAASSGFTRNPSFIDELVGRFQPAVAAPELPVPDAPRITTEAAPAVDPAAVPSASEAASIPVPAPAAPAENSAQAQAQAIPAAPAPNAPAPADAAHKTAKDPQETASQDKASQDKPTQVLPSRPDTKPEAPKPDSSKAAAATPAKPAHGAQGNKPGQWSPALTEQRAEEEFQSAIDKWKQWLKRTGR